jgi:PTH1 family peptidyl-tRNA hydrolase
VGLGNPGPQYRDSRHNVGFRVLEEVAERLGAGFRREKFGGLVAEIRQAKARVLLLKPMTYMNRSGASVAQAVRNRKMDLSTDLLVVLDEAQLPLGRIRMRADGSDGGHNGLRSVIEHLGTDQFPRLRIGVGKNKPGDDLAEHVLSAFTREERPEIESAIRRAASGVLTFIDRGTAAAINECNAPSAAERSLRETS